VDSLWPWLAVVAAGALHGLSPASGWLWVAWRARGPERVQTSRALLPIALGHLVSVGLVAAAVAAGASIDRTWSQAVAMLLLVAVVWHHLRRRGRRSPRIPAGHAGLALWSFIVSTGHGAGLMLVPALIPLCAPGSPGREANAGALGLALVALGVHTAAMLLACGIAANMAGWVLRVGRRRPAGTSPHSNRSEGRPGSTLHNSGNHVVAEASNPWALLNSTSARPCSGQRSTSDVKPAYAPPWNMKRRPSCGSSSSPKR
jgi:hypothetical protein